MTPQRRLVHKVRAVQECASTHTHTHAQIGRAVRPHSSPPALSQGWHVGVFSIKHLLSSNRPLFSFQRSQRPPGIFSRHTVQASSLTRRLSEPLCKIITHVLMWYTSAMGGGGLPCQRKNINILEPAAPVMVYRER